MRDRISTKVTAVQQRRKSLETTSVDTRATATRVGVLSLVVVLAAAGHAWYGNRQRFFDLRIYRSAMLWWENGHPLYSFSQPDKTQGHLEFTYPPFGAYLLRPLAWLSWSQAVVAFSVVAVVAFGASMWWLLRPVADAIGEPRWFVMGVGCVLATGLEPIREAFTMGQVNFVLWALVLADLLVLAPRASRWTGVGIGLATAIKLVPGVFILYLMVTRRWRAAAVAAGTAATVTLLAAAGSPDQSWFFWTRKVLHSDGVGQLAYAFNQSAMGVIARAVAPAQPSTFAWLALALPLLGFGLWRAARAAGAGDEVTGLTLAGIAGSLASPVTWAHHIFWFVPALIVLVTRVRLEPGSRLTRLWWPATLYLTVTVSLVALYDNHLKAHPNPWTLVLASWDVIIMVALLVTLPVDRPAVPAPAGVEPATPAASVGAAPADAGPTPVSAP